MCLLSRTKVKDLASVCLNPHVCVCVLYLNNRIVIRGEIISMCDVALHWVFRIYVNTKKASGKVIVRLQYA